MFSFFDILGFKKLRETKGAISHGDLIDDQNGIYIGSVVEDAYINETRQVWSGCIITEKCREYLEVNDMINNRKIAYISEIENNPGKIELLKQYSKIIVKYDVPMQENPKNDKLKYYQKEYYALDWTARV